MRSIIYFLFVAFLIGLYSCGSSRKMANEYLLNSTWELEFIAENEASFDSIFSKTFPNFVFNQQEGKVYGNSGCNGYSADFNISGQSISFGEPGPATKMYCGGGENIFLDKMDIVNRYRIDDMGKLVLLSDDKVLLRFRRKS